VSAVFGSEPGAKFILGHRVLSTIAWTTRRQDVLDGVRSSARQRDAMIDL